MSSPHNSCSRVPFLKAAHESHTSKLPTSPVAFRQQLRNRPPVHRVPRRQRMVRDLDAVELQTIALTIHPSNPVIAPPVRQLGGIVRRKEVEVAPVHEVVRDDRPARTWAPRRSGGVKLQCCGNGLCRPSQQRLAYATHQYKRARAVLGRCCSSDDVGLLLSFFC